MLLSLLIILPLVAGLILSVIKNEKPLGFVGTAVSLYLFVYTLFLVFTQTPVDKEILSPWFKLGDVQTYISLDLTGLGAVLVLLTTFTYAMLFIYFMAYKKSYSNNFYGLLLLMFAGLNGVFMAQDLLLFYFFWEIVLIVIYFLIGLWGNKKDRVRANTIFFIFTIFGSFLMLAGIIYIGFQLKPESYLLKDVAAVTQSFNNTELLAWLFLIGFAIKIPLFPLHAWQPPVYKTSATPVTIVLSALMAKMGLFAVVNWLLNMFPDITACFDWVLYVVGFGLVYASLIALTSNNLKRIIAFSSIAHLALIFMALYSMSEIGTKGAYFQMFSHGIVVLGMWLSYDYMNQKYGVTDIKSLSGLAKVDPAFAVFWTIFCLANLSLPFTSSFIGEFSMLNALFSYNPVLCIMGCIGAILAPAYTWRMNNSILLGETKHLKGNPKQMSGILYFVFGVLSFVIILLGVYPSVLFNLM